MIVGWEHLAWAAAGTRDTATVARALDTLERMGAGPYFLENEGVNKILLYRAWLALRRHDGSAKAYLDSLYLGAMAPGRNFFVTAVALQGLGEPAAQVALNRRLLDHGLAPDDRRDVSMLQAFAWAMRGAWDSALVVRDQLIRGPTDAREMLNAYRTAVLAAWVGAMPPAEALRRRPALAPLIMERGGGFPAEMAWLDGILAVAGNDLNGLVAARTALKASGGKWTANLDRSLGAFESALRGDRRSAATAMATLEWELAEGDPYFAGSADTPHALLRGVDRLAAAEWLQDQGDGAQALRLLQWHQTFPFFDDKLPLKPLAFLLSARIEDARGDTAAARGNYEEFLHRFDMPMPPQRHLVVEARDALARVSGAATPDTDR